MRDLDKVWEEEMTTNGYRFGPDNTVMIDDTMEKMREHPHNVLIVPPITAESLVRGDGDSSVLINVHNYIKQMLLELSSKPTSVPDYISKWTFDALNDIEALSSDFSNTTLTE